jgi:hypothetical protein
VIIYTDHQTLENFDHQKDLSQRQARWQEFLAQYNHHIVYIPGEQNTVADALSRLPDSVDECTPCPVAAMLTVQTDPTLLTSIMDGYKTDPFCIKLFDNQKSMDGVECWNGLLYVGNCLVIPHVGSLCEDLFHLTHDSLGHFSFEKSYASLRDSYYWPHMRSDLQSTYIPSCITCQ